MCVLSLPHSLSYDKCYHPAGTFLRNGKNKYNCRTQLCKQCGCGERNKLKILILTKKSQISNSGLGCALQEEFLGKARIPPCDSRPRAGAARQPFHPSWGPKLSCNTKCFRPPGPSFQHQTSQGTNHIPARQDSLQTPLRVQVPRALHQTTRSRSQLNFAKELSVALEAAVTLDEGG